MEQSDLREILSRLETLERAVVEMQESDRHDGRDRRDERDRPDDRDRRDGGRDGGGGVPDEKRIVDLIVRLVAEHVDEIIVRRLAQLEESLLAPEPEPEPEPEPAQSTSQSEPHG